MWVFRREPLAPFPPVCNQTRSGRLAAFLRLQGKVARRIISTGPTGNAALWSRVSRPGGIDYLASLGLVVLITGFGLQIERSIASTNLAMLYLLAVVVSALRWGRGPALSAALLSAVAFDLFVLPPHQSVAADIWYQLTLVSLPAVGLLISTLAGEAREQAETARSSQAATEAMYEFSQSLAVSMDIDQILESAGRQIVETFECPTLMAIPAQTGLGIRFRSPEFPDDAEERAAMEWAFRRNEAAGCGTGNMPRARGYYLPLRTAWGIKGVLGVIPQAAGSRLADRRHPMLEVFASRTALAIGRAAVEETARQAELLRETGKMQKALLHSISHNLRTPLATITGVLQTLLHDSAVLDEPTRIDLLTNAEEQALRLNRLVGNLLDMTRLEAGALNVKIDVCDLQDVIGAALEQLGEAAHRRSIILDLSPQPILAPLDFALISQVIVNLVDNALKYSPAHEPVEIRVRQRRETL